MIDEKLASMLSGVGLILVVIFCFAFLGFAVNVSAECLALGYRDSKITYKFDRYCILRLDQTDIVVPIERARMEPKK